MRSFRLAIWLNATISKSSVLLPIAVALPLFQLVQNVKAEQYITIKEAQTILFPKTAKFNDIQMKLTDREIDLIEERSGVAVSFNKLNIWAVTSVATSESSEKNLGYFLVDRVFGKHEYITYAIAINADLSVKGIEILEYKEAYGYQIRYQKWLQQFLNKTVSAPLKLTKDVVNISGATISCISLTDGVRRILSTMDVLKTTRSLDVGV